MGRPKSKNSETQMKVVKASPEKKNKSPKKSPIKVTKVQEAQILPVQFIEPPLFQCRRCGNGYETTEDYANHECANPITKPLFTLVEEETEKDDTEQFTIIDISPEQTEQNEEQIEEQVPQKKTRKPYKKREKSTKSPKEKTSQDRVECPKCHKTFTRKYHLERHLTHTSCNEGNFNREEFSCEVCNKVFTRVDNLRMHLRAHLGQKPKSKDFQCPYCEKSFTGSSLLNIHVRTHTKEKPYKCDFCEKGFPSSGALTKHRRVHTGERPYECPMCGNRFSAKETLNRHVKTHTGKRDHKCNICGKDFIQNTQLKAHMFHHNDENAMVCDLCGKKFNRKTRLTEHLVYIHLKKKMPECNMCKKQFMRKEDLNRHLETHIGERKHSCSQCEKKFVTKAAVKIHMRVHQVEDPARCSYCQKNFLRMDCLVRHLRMKHREMLKQIIVDAETKKIRKTLGGEGNELEEVEIIYEPSNYLKNDAQISSSVDIIELVPQTTDDDDEATPIFLDDNLLEQRIAELLQIVIEESVLKDQGFRKKSIDEVLCSVLEKCCRTPLKKDSKEDDSTRLRENTKLLFTLVLDEDHIQTLLNNYTVDEVITIVIRMSK